MSIDVSHLLPSDLLTDRPAYWKYFLFRIQGIEVTQAIQYYRAAAHLTDPADRGPDNSVTLVAGKPAWVRVYVRSGLIGSITGVTGTLEISRRSFGFLYSHVDTLSPQPPGTVTARNNPAYATERGTLGYTLNFIIPAGEMCGSLRLRARVQTPGGDTDEMTVDLDVTLQQTLHLAGILVSYNGPASSAPNAPNLNLTAPTVADLQTTSAWALLTFPVQSAATFRSAGTIAWNLPLTDNPSCNGCCTPNWVALNSAVQAQKVADGNRTDVLYYGLLPAGIPRGPIIGCESSGVSSGANGDTVTLAHEVGHACGLSHAPCGTPGDPNYPAYEPYDPANTPQASIGEYGLDISTGNIFSPATFKDMMAYCGPRWISLYHNGKLTNNANLDPVRVCVDYPWWKDIVLTEPYFFPWKWLPDPPPDEPWRKWTVDPEPVISIIGVVHSDREIEIKSIMRVEAIRQVQNASPTDLSAELVGSDGRILAEAPLYNLRSYGGGDCGCEEKEEHSGARYPFLFQTFVSNVEPGTSLRIRRADKEIWTRRAPASEPVITSFQVRAAGRARKGAKGRDQLKFVWKVKSAGAENPEGWLQWSSDRGKTWNALATGVRESGITLDAAAIPSGRLQVRLLVSDGFHTARSESVSVEIAPRAPAVSILSPREGQTCVAGGAMRLLGAATQSTGEPVPGKNARWEIDGKQAGDSTDVFVTAPPAGQHRLTLIVTVQGRKTEASIKFQTVQVPKETEET